MNTAKQFAKNRQAVTWTFLLFPLPLGVYYIGKTYISTAHLPRLLASSSIVVNSHTLCSCRRFWAKELTREELDKQFPDSQTLAQHQVTAAALEIFLF